MVPGPRQADCLGLFQNNFEGVDIGPDAPDADARVLDLLQLGIQQLLRTVRLKQLVVHDLDPVPLRLQQLLLLKRLRAQPEQILVLGHERNLLPPVILADGIEDLCDGRFGSGRAEEVRVGDLVGQRDVRARPTDLGGLPGFRDKRARLWD